MVLEDKGIQTGGCDIKEVGVQTNIYSINEPKTLIVGMSWGRNAIKKYKNHHIYSK